MKAQPALLLIVTLSPLGVLLSAQAQTDRKGSAAPEPAASSAIPAVPESWEVIKDYSYEQRADFIGILGRLSEKLDGQLRAINAKATGLPYAVAQKREAATKEFNESRSYLKSQLTDLNTVTADTWVDAKARVVEAWKSVQTAYDKAASLPIA